MNHSFDVEVAKEVGVIAAILFQNIAFWCQHSKANGNHFHEGRYWTYNTNKAFCEIFPYMSSKAIRNGLNKLVDAGMIVTGNFNERTYDRTIWYALSQKGECIFQKGQMEVAKKANGSSQKGEPIPDINTDINADINPDNSGVRKRFRPPTVDEVRSYASEKKWTAAELDPEYFVSFYESKGWKVGKDKMESWKAAARGWVARHRREHPNEAPPVYKDADYENDW